MQRYIILFAFLAFVSCLIVPAEKYALVIGIHYKKLPANQAIPECEKDAIAMAELLQEKMGFDPDNIILVTNEKATQEGIRKSFKALQSKVKDGDVVCIFYSGHGQTLADDNGDEATRKKDDKLDETIVPFDLKNIRDDELGILLEEIANKNVNVLFLLDSCYSGTANKVISMNRDNTYAHPKVFKPTASKSKITERDMVLVRRTRQQNSNDPTPSNGEDNCNDTKPTKGKIVFISASADTEVSWTLEEKGNSAFTYHFLHQFDNNLQNDTNRDGQVTFEESYKFVRQEVLKESLPEAQNPTIEGDEKILQELVLYPNFFAKVEKDPDPDTDPQPDPDKKVKMYELIERLMIRQAVMPASEDWKVELSLIPAETTFKVGEYIQVEATPNQSGYLLILNLTEKGNVRLLFPNSECKEYKVEADQAIKIPPEDAEWGIQAQPPVGKEWIVAYLLAQDPLAGIDIEDTFEKEFILETKVEAVKSHQLKKGTVKQLIKKLTSSPKTTEEEPSAEWTSAVVEYTTTEK